MAVAATPALAVPGDWEGFRGLPDTVLEVGQSSVAAGDGGRGVAVWSAAGPDSGRLTVAVRTPDGRWGPSEVLDAGLPSGGFRPQAAINARGDMAVAWTTRDGVRVALRPAGGATWSDSLPLPAALDGPLAGYALAVDGHGQVTVLLAGPIAPDGVSLRSLAAAAGGGWDERVLATGVSVTDAEVVVSATRDATLAARWAGADGRRRMATRLPSGRWTAPRILPGPRAGATPEQSVTAGPGGTTTILVPVIRESRALLRASGTAGGGPLRPFQTIARCAGALGWRPAVVDGAGRATAAWSCRSTFGARALVNTIATATAPRFGRFGPASVVARGPAHGNVLALGADLGGRAVLAWSPSGLSPDGLIAAVRPGPSRAWTMPRPIAGPGTGALRGLTAGIGLRGDAWVAAQRGELSVVVTRRVR